MALFADEYKVPVLSPAVAATMAATFEVGCSILLVAGLATRVATLPLLAQIFVIQTFVYPSAWPEHLVWSSILLLLLTRGGGAVSIDHLIDGWWESHHADSGDLWMDCPPRVRLAPTWLRWRRGPRERGRGRAAMR